MVVILNGVNDPVFRLCLSFVVILNRVKDPRIWSFVPETQPAAPIANGSFS
jgi:hypothetical protein